MLQRRLLHLFGANEVVTMSTLRPWHNHAFSDEGHRGQEHEGVEEHPWCQVVRFVWFYIES